MNETDEFTAESSNALVPVAAPEPVDPRPWHGSDSPFEALYAHFTGEISRLEKMMSAPAPNRGTSAKKPSESDTTTTE